MVTIVIGDDNFISIDRDKLKQSEYYSGVLAAFTGNISALILNNKKELAIDYINFLLGKELNCSLKDNLEYCFYVGDQEYLKRLVIQLLWGYDENKFIIPQLHLDLQRDVYLWFPYPLFPMR